MTSRVAEGTTAKNKKATEVTQIQFTNMRCRQARNQKTHIVFTGNPGGGKSTILNSLCGEVRFRSGVSFGNGLTSVVQEVELEDRVLADTPGLSDIRLREQAAKEIEKLFRSVDEMKLIFVITLESGRIRPVDLTTMKLILDALGVKDLNNRFAIIINKLSNKVMSALSNADQRTILFECLNGSETGYQTQFIQVLEKDPDLEDSDNILATPDPKIVELIDNMLPLQVDHDTLQRIDITDIETKTAEYEERITKIVNASQEQLEEMKRQHEVTSTQLIELTMENNRLELARIQEHATAQNAILEERQQAALERLRLENQAQNAEMRADLERKLMEAQLAEQRQETQRQAQRAEDARAHAAQQAAFLHQQQQALQTLQNLNNGGGGGCLIC
jgi:GTP-binding protein EngB required for normal cell division